MKLLQTADLHFSNNKEKREEVITCTDHILTVAAAEGPDTIVLSGDTVDEFDGAIRIDSEAARAAISFVKRAADIAPVVIIRGTKSHDRETPYLFAHLGTKYPVHVSNQVEMVALMEGHNCSTPSFQPFNSIQQLIELEVAGYVLKTVFTCIPSLDKSYLMGQVDASIKEGNAQTKEFLHDLFKGIGQINKQITTVPRVAVIHGMMTGAQFSSGQTAIGEDLEFGLNDLAQLEVDYVAMGHVHKFQSFKLSNGALACYSGSPGRLNFGETEEKGFLMANFDGQKVKDANFHPTPARRFALYDIQWGESGVDGITAEAEKCKAECHGADVRFRYTIPEEEKYKVNRDELGKSFLYAGARKVKIEVTIIPKTRQRAAGISRITTLPKKVKMWGQTVGENIPEQALKIAETIEGKEVEELIAEAMSRVEGAEKAAPTISTEERKERVKASMERYFESQESKTVDHGPLFEAAA